MKKRYIWLFSVCLLMVACGQSTTSTPKLVKPTGTTVYQVTNTPYITPTLPSTSVRQHHTPTPLYPTQVPSGSCQAHNGLPDATCTPGDSFVYRTPAVICAPGYARSVRNVTQAEKDAVYQEYGVRNRMVGQYEVDHLVPLEIGGTNDIKNLWPELANPAPGYHQKDVLENVMHSLMCSGKIHLTQAQHEIQSDWIAAYRKYVGNSMMP